MLYLFSSLGTDCAWNFVSPWKEIFASWYYGEWCREYLMDYTCSHLLPLVMHEILCELLRVLLVWFVTLLVDNQDKYNTQAFVDYEFFSF